MIDIHSHILPGVDDGADSLETAVAMLRLAGESGTTDIVATPHANLVYHYDRALIEDKIAELQEASGSVVRIHCGCDFHLTVDNIRSACRNPGLYTIAGKNYLLIEFSDDSIPNTTTDIFARLQGGGMTPIITHPERNPLLQKRPELIAKWVEHGALVQVTAQSFMGLFGKKAKAAADGLLRRGLVHFVASDAHDREFRTANLAPAYRYVEAALGWETAQALFVENPGAAINGATVKAVPAVPLKYSWFRVWKSA